MTLVLASGSKYRLNLLQNAGFSPEVIPPELNEAEIKNQLTSQGPLQIAQTLAALKAESVQEKICKNAHLRKRVRPTDYLVLASDQVCSYNKKLLNKPQNFATNVSQLLEMSGQDHQLITCVHILACIATPLALNNFINSKLSLSMKSHPSPLQVIAFHDITTLTMKSLSLEEIKDYVQKDQPYDCAGGYKYESQGHTLFSQVQSEDLSAIEGLPMKTLKKIIEGFLKRPKGNPNV